MNNYCRYAFPATLLNPKLYVEAACQNGFDTAAGMGLLSAYAAYFSRNTGAVLYGVFLPSINNLVRYRWNTFLRISILWNFSFNLC